ncbi:MAG: protein kinase domain-containing protein, partial [bacterium]
MAPAAPAGSLTALPTQQGLTQEGTILGTFQYMAPEQLEGKEADARSDLWAFGATLYEMTTGKKAFEGRSQASLIAASLERDPTPITTLAPLAPPGLERLVRACLAKDPDERWQTAHDVRLQLKQIAEGGSQSGTPALVVRRRPNRGVWAWGLSAILALVAGAALVVAYLAGQKQLPVLRVEINPPAKMQFNLAGDNGGPAMISPDGHYLVFSANGISGTQLYLRSLDSLSSQALPGTEGGTFPFWSPDSRSIAFFTNDKLKRVEVAGGPAASICDSALGRGGSWNQDGTIVAALSYNSGISRVPASGGVPTPITKVDNVTYTSHRWPWFLPDGQHFLYVAVNHNSPASPDTGVFVASLDGKENRLLAHTLSSAIYASGHLLSMRDNSLVAQAFDPSGGRFSGEPETLSENVQYDAGLWRANLSASTGGMLVYASGAASGTQILAWYDRDGKQFGTVGERGGFFDLSLSPDQKKLAVTDAN